jgi:DNA mismatch endonuclease (patch repair protein)
VDRSENMRRIRSRDTGPEMVVRRLVHKMGYRYRLYRADLPGTPDLVFPARHKVIDVFGCFFHSHGCKLSHVPRSNTGYWLPKLERNKRRDTEQHAALYELGWERLVIWECEVKVPDKLKQRIVKFLAQRGR